MKTTFTLNDHSRLELYVIRANGQGSTVRFVPPVLFGNVGVSTFTTNDDALAAAIKKHPYYGQIVFLREEVANAAETPKTVTVAESKDYAALCDATKPIVTVDAVTSIAAANHWLQSEHGQVFSSKKIDDIKSEAASKYNTLFPNL